MDANSSGLTLAAKGLALLVVIFMFRYAETFTTIFSFQQIGIVPSIVAMLVLASGVGALLVSRKAIAGDLSRSTFSFPPSPCFLVTA
ncbi:hypothetical protein JCM19237_3816 [Photobacterium aphoticum]|uniref:Uncharacterized protein n=1 Tax=Photobacterium aphoticum TaxID=754436 RepID=A0A090QU75_9GAMM|nr:hypothetical protein JCM19237_3816 [Photobacterium aphoticum]